MSLLTKSPAAELIKQQIQKLGPLPFDQFVDLALYHPTYGYYNRKAPQRGRQGDYYTSLQVSSLFPKIFADVFLHMKEELNTDQFHIIEYGSGGGEFLEGVLTELDRRNKLKGFQVWSVEKSRRARDQLVRRLSRFPKTRVVSTMEQADLIGGIDGCIFSNEFFDAIAFHRLRYSDSGWKEIFVDWVGGEFKEKEGPLSSPDLLKEIDLSELEFSQGHEIEVRPNLGSLWDEWRQILSRGYVLTFDYGHPRYQLYSDRRKKGTWLCYHKHQVNENPFNHIGDQDITAHVDFTQLAELGQAQDIQPALFCSQGLFLTHLGQDLFQDYLSTAPENEKRKRTAAIQQLLHPDALGESFWTLLHTKEVNLPSTMKSISNRIRRLVKNS